MCSHSKSLRTGLLAALLILGSITGIMAQSFNYINQTVQVLPPYTNKLSDYFDTPGKIVSIITSNANEIDSHEYRYYIHGYIQSVNDDGAIRIGTRSNHRPAIPSVMRAILGPDGGFVGWPPYTLTYSDYREIFNPRNLEYRGISQEQVEREGLPADIYQICFRVYMDPYGDGYTVQGDFCSPPFTIIPEMSEIEPPIIIQPYDQANINSLAAQTVQFSWTMPPGAPVSTQYKLKIIELSDDAARNYHDMLRNDSYPAFFETNITGAPLYLYTVANPAFKTGKSYAFLVRAIDPMNRTKFKNQGFSEVHLFNVKQSMLIPDGMEIVESYKPKPKTGNSFEVTNKDPVPVNQVKGRLYYRFKDAEATSKQTTSDASTEQYNVDYSQGSAMQLSQSGGISSVSASGTQVQVSGQTDIMSQISADNLLYNKDNTPLYNARPLAGKRVSLVLTYLFTGTNIDDKLVQAQYLDKDGRMMKHLPDDLRGSADKVIATTITGADGSFTFNFLNLMDDLGMQEEYLNIEKGSHEFKDRFHGHLFKVLRIRVEDKYYLSPDVNVKLNPWEGIDLGNIVSFVKSYTLKVNVKTDNTKFWDMGPGDNTILPMIQTEIIRKDKIASVPVNEGGDKKGIMINPPEGKRVAKGESDGNGSIIFKYMVQHDPDNSSDRYHVMCVPDKKQGNFIFPKQLKKYVKHDKSEYVDFPFNTQREYTPDPDPDPKVIILPVTYGSDAVWNHQLVIKTYETTINLKPGAPRMAGIVEVGSEVGARPLDNVKVVMNNLYVLDKNKVPAKLFNYVMTDQAGRFEFNDLPVELESKAWDGKSPVKVIGPERLLLTQPAGFKGAVLPGDNIPYSALKWGQQFANLEFKLTPDGLFKGEVVDESGDPVRATIDVDGYVRFETKSVLKHLDMEKKRVVFAQRFEGEAPSGKRKITITPNDLDYEVKDTTLTIKKAHEKTDEIRFVVKLKQKRIRFRVIEYTAAPALLDMGVKPIAGAKVKLKDSPQVPEQTTDKDGYVNFNFINNNDNFTFTITSPENSDYEDGHYTLTGVENSTETKTYSPAKLKKAALISGTVTLGPENKPLEDAVVYIDMGDSRIEAKTDKAGQYTLRKIPSIPAQKTVYAVKSAAQPMIIGQNKEIKVELGKENRLDFNLLTDNEMIIQKIFGFDVEITEKSARQKDRSWLISGNLLMSGNENFTLQDEKQKSIPFTNLKVKESGKKIDGIPEAVPSANQLTSDLATLKLYFQNAFAVVQYPGSGEQLQVKAAGQKGKVEGKVFVQKSSLGTSEMKLQLNNDPEKALLMTDKPGSATALIATIESDGAEKKRFGVTGINGKALKFNLLGFEASAAAANSWIEGDLINLATRIEIKVLPGMSPSTILLDAGNLRIGLEKIEPLNSDKPIKFKLEKWEFEGEKWVLHPNNRAISIENGVMKTGVVDIPLQDINIEPEKLKIGKIEVDKLTMGGVLPVDVLTKDPVFGLNPNCATDHRAHYELRFIGKGNQPGVEIKNLPGMKAGDAFRFQNFSLFSNGDQTLNPGNQSNDIMLYSVMKVRPFSFNSASNYVLMDCGVDLDIPQLAETTAVIQYMKEGGQTVMRLFPINVSLDGPGGVSFRANVTYDDKPQLLREGEFSAMGRIVDKEGIDLKSVLYKTTKEAWVEVKPENQILPLGDASTRMANIKGKMVADMNVRKWNNFVFSGEMQGFKGMEGNTRKTFTVTGSINAANEKIEMKNVPSTFGNIGITYDIANRRFHGNLQIDQDIGPLGITGVADLLVDNYGWYMLAGGRLKTPGLGEFNAGLLLGNYKAMSPDVTTKLMQFAYNKNVPKSFEKGVSGFFFTGNKDLPIINIPDWSINLGVVNAKFGVKAGVDARLWMDFDKSGSELGIGAMVFALAYLKGESITCMRFGAEARAEMGVQGIYTTSNGTFSLAGCGSFTITGTAEQCIPLPCWDGVCCTSCVGISQSLGVKIDLLLDSKGNTDLSFGFGNCSGQNPMSTNW